MATIDVTRTELVWPGKYDEDGFGHPETYLTRLGATSRFGGTGDVSDDILLTWWWDPEHVEATEQARAAGKKLEQGQVEVRPWVAANGAAPTG